MVRRVDRNEEGGCNLVQKVFGFCAASIDISVRSLAENAGRRRLQQMGVALHAAS